jgi:hypothetical protein
MSPSTTTASSATPTCSLTREARPPPLPRAPWPSTPPEASWYSRSCAITTAPIARRRLDHRRPEAERQPVLHAALPAPDQRQGRALHPDPARRMGLRDRLWALLLADPDPDPLSLLLRLRITPQRPTRPTARLPLDGSAVNNTRIIYLLQGGMNYGNLNLAVCGRN